MRRLLIAATAAAMLLAWPGGTVAAKGAGGVTVGGPAAAAVTFDGAALARLPAQRVAVSFLSAQGNRNATFVGPLLWQVLEQAKAVDPARHQDQVAQFVVLTGRDGYRAVVALAELAPEFEGKQIVLARERDGKPLGDEHLRVVVPGDRRGGRSVRDIARIEVRTLPKD